MADPWPASLPTLRLPVSLTMRDGVIRSQNDIGPAQTRRATTAMPEPFSHAVRWTPAQLSTFRTFWRTTIQDGALPFELALPLPINATANLRFVSAPEFQKLGAHYIATFSLEIMP